MQMFERFDANAHDPVVPLPSSAHHTRVLQVKSNPGAFLCGSNQTRVPFSAGQIKSCAFFCGSNQTLVPFAAGQIKPWCHFLSAKASLSLFQLIARNARIIQRNREFKKGAATLY
jgi:hypothetical protein